MERRDEPGGGRCGESEGMREVSDEWRRGERWRKEADEEEEAEVEREARSSTRRYRNSAAAAVCAPSSVSDVRILWHWAGTHAEVPRMRDRKTDTVCARKSISSAPRPAREEAFTHRTCPPDTSPTQPPRPSSSPH